MSAAKFLDKLEQTGLLDDKVLDILRKQVANSQKRVSPQALAKFLIDKGHLTPKQAKKLLEGFDSTKQPPSAGKGKPAAAKPTKPPEQELTPLDDDLKTVEDLAPLEELSPLDDGNSHSPFGGGELTPLSDDSLQPNGGGQATATAQQPRGGGLMSSMKSIAAEKPIRTTVWDSKLLLLGGGGLVFLLLSGFLLWWVLTSQPAQKIFEAAEKAYNEQSYAQAIELSEQFLDKSPSHEKASLAKVMKTMARLRQGHASKNWDKTFDDAKSLLPEIEGEKAFGAFARPELATILPDIANGFAEAGRGTNDLAQAKAFADKADEAMLLVDNPNYIPTSFRTTQINKIERIQENIAFIRRRISEEAELATALAKIDAHIQQGETIAAFDVRRNLLKLYPGLEVHADLIAAVMRISAKERELVALEEGQIEPLTTDEPSTTAFSVIVASRRGNAATGVPEGPLFVLAKGSAYGINGVTGEVLWRRFIGFATDIHPLTLGVGENADALLVDTNRHELVRVKGSTGALVWRLPIPADAAPFTAPVLINDLVYVGDRSGALREINPDDGTVQRVVRIPKPLVVGPVHDEENELIYQLGEHSNLYVLSANSLECTEVYYLGHKEGSITLRPTLVRGVAFIVENVGSDYSVMHVLRPDDKSKSLAKMLNPIRLGSRVRTPPLTVAAGNVGRLIVLGERSSVQVYEIDLRNEKTPVAEVANQADTNRIPQVGYHLVDGGEYWLGDSRLTKYDIQTTRNQLARRWMTDDKMISLAPLEKRGKVLYTVRRRQGSAGVSIAAVQAVDGEQLWQTDLGVPLAGPAIVDAANRRIVAVTSHGELFDIDSQVLQRGYIDRPSHSYDLSESVSPYHRQIALGGGNYLFFNPKEPEKLLLLDLAGGSRRLNTKTLPVAPGALTTPPKSWQGGLLLPLAAGRVEWNDLTTSGKNLLPFQPPLETGTQIQWSEPATVGDGAQFAIANNQKKVYLIGINARPKEHLAAAGEANLDSQPISALAATSDTLYGVARKDGLDHVFSFALPSLTPNQDHPLDGLVVWGPQRLGNHVILATDRGQLIGFESGHEPKWRMDLPYGPLAGAPIGTESLLLMASRSGVVSMYDTAAGEEKLKVDIGQPLSTQPVVFNKQLLLSGSDGMIHLTNPLDLSGLSAN